MHQILRSDGRLRDCVFTAAESHTTAPRSEHIRNSRCNNGPTVPRRFCTRSRTRINRRSRCVAPELVCFFDCGGERDAGPMRRHRSSQTGHGSISAVIRDLDLVHVQCQDLSVSDVQQGPDVCYADRPELRSATRWRGNSCPLAPVSFCIVFQFI